MPRKDLRKLYDFSGKTTIVTGGALGIGFAIARRFHETGANVVIADVDEVAGRNNAAELGERALFVRCDVADEQDVASLIQQTITRFDRIDILINNAGIFPTSMLLDMSVETWNRVLATNLRGTFLCSREAARLMQDTGGGSIINISSIEAITPTQEGLAAYGSSKHGMTGLTMAMAREFAQHNIRVNAIAPGGVTTEGVELMMKQEASEGIDMQKIIKEFTDSVPMKRFGEPDEIALPALFLASDAASYITGATLVIDGGALVG